MFTLEIAGRPIAVISAASRQDAEAWLSDEDFREDLQTLEHDGRPLWDGTAALSVREASQEEAAEAQDALSGDEEDDPDEDEFMVFLVAVTDPDESTEDEP
jgi:hypothetical protein